MATETQRKPRILCFHGYTGSGEIMKKELEKWPQKVIEKLEFVCPDAPFPVEGTFDHPSYEWFEVYENKRKYRNFEECIAYIEDIMVNHGPFDGLLGLSQGAMLAASAPGMQAEGEAYGMVEKIKFVIMISGSKFGGRMFGTPKLAANAFRCPIECQSLHFIGDKDWMKDEGIALIESFVEPVVIHHPGGHCAPQIDENMEEIMLCFVDKIYSVLNP